VESRASGGNHTLVIAFNNEVVSGSASVSSGVGSVSGSPAFSGNTMTVNLAGVADAQNITINLDGVTDSFGQSMPTSAITMGTLVGDVSGNGSVNSSDLGQVKSQSGVPVNTTNFRADVTPNGTINATDVTQVKASSGRSIQ